MRAGPFERLATAIFGGNLINFDICAAAESSLMSSKKGLPIYTIEVMRRKPTAQHFEMGRVEENVERFSFASTPHRHDCFFFMLVTRGSGIHKIDTIEYNVKPFATYLMLPGQVHGWSFSKDIAGYYIYFTLEFYNSYARERHIEKFPYLRVYTPDTYVQFDPVKDAHLPAMLEAMYDEFTQKRVGWDDFLRNCLDILLILITRKSTSATTIKGTTTTVNHIRKLQILIEEHFTKLKLPSEYAKLMNMTPKHLNALCKGALNKTFTDLIQERLLLEAKRYLVYTDKSIKQISKILGFNDLSYFMRFFKKHMNQTPDQFRKSVTYVKSLREEGVL